MVQRRQKSKFLVVNKKKMRKSSIVFFVCWSLLVVFLLTTEMWSFYNPMHALHNDLRCLAGEFHAMCQEESLVYWICAGTLLGSVRHGDIIKHDDDIDFAIKLEDLPKLQLIAPQYDLKLTPGLWSGLWQIRKEGLRGVVDIFPVQQKENRYKYIDMAYTLWPNEAFHLDDTFDTLYPLGKYCSNSQPETFVDLQLFGPKRVNNAEYFECAYGSSWRIPAVTFVHTLTGLRETFWFSVCISALLLVLLGVQIKQTSQKKK